MLANAMVPAKE